MSSEDRESYGNGGASGDGYPQCPSCEGAGRVPTKYHDILDIPLGVSSEEITRAFRRKAMQHHPDRNKAPDATARMQEVSEARSMLFGSESIRAGAECALCGGRGTAYARQSQSRGARAEQPSGGGAGSSSNSGADEFAGAGGGRGGSSGFEDFRVDRGAARAGGGWGVSSRMRGWIGIAATLAVGVVALVYFAAATEDAYERVTEELLPGMQWGELEPGLEGYVRAIAESGMQWVELEPGFWGFVRVESDMRESNAQGIQRGNQPTWVGKFIDHAAQERGEALAYLGVDAFMTADFEEGERRYDGTDNLYLHWRKFYYQSSEARNALFEMLEGMWESPADTPYEELTPQEQALYLWRLIIRMEDDEEREESIAWWVERYEGTEEGDYVLRNISTQAIVIENATS